MTYYIAFPGKASDESHFGGTPYYLSKAFNAIGCPSACLDLVPPPRIRWLRLAWNALNLIRGKGKGGFQYSDIYLNHVWQEAPEFSAQDTIINLFQVFGPKALQSPARKVFYFDMTLCQLFREYKLPISLPLQAAAIAKETACFHAADLILTKSQWAANSVIEDYGIAPDKVKAVVAGANVADDLVTYLEHAPPPPPHDRVRFLFIGKEPERKGLFRFLDAVRLLPDLKDHIELHLVGLDESLIPASYRDICPMVIHGFINKKRESQRFCDVMLACDVGILLSTAEAGGFSLREFQLAGMAVIAPRVGGSPEWVEPGAGVFVNPEDDAQAIALLLGNLLARPETIAAMRAAARLGRANIGWRQTARQILAHIEALPAQA